MRPPPRETEEEREARLNDEANEAFWQANPHARALLRGPKSMPHISQMFESKWITRADVESPVIATIRACTPETFRGRGGGGPETRWILWFHEAKKGLRLNSTNIKTLAEGFGEHTEQWIGQRVRLYVDPHVQMAGQTVGGVRIQCPRAAHPAAFAQPQQQTQNPGAPTLPPGVSPFAFSSPPAGGAFAGQPRQPAPNGAFGPTPDSRPGAFGNNFDPNTGEIYGAAGAAGREAAKAPGGVDSEFDDDIPL
jgi:hypothetical protein